MPGITLNALCGLLCYPYIGLIKCRTSLSTFSRQGSDNTEGGAIGQRKRQIIKTQGCRHWPHFWCRVVPFEYPEWHGGTHLDFNLTVTKACWNPVVKIQTFKVSIILVKWNKCMVQWPYCGQAVLITVIIIIIIKFYEGSFLVRSYIALC